MKLESLIWTVAKNCLRLDENFLNIRMLVKLQKQHDVAILEFLTLHERKIFHTGTVYTISVRSVKQNTIKHPSKTRLNDMQADS